MTDQMNSVQPQKIIQVQFPITWLLSVAGGLIVLGGGLIFQLSTATNGIGRLENNMAELKVAQDKRDDRMATMSASNIKIESQMLSLQTQLMRVNEDLNDLRRTTNQNLRDQSSQQWQMPKGNLRNQ